MQRTSRITIVLVAALTLPSALASGQAPAGRFVDFRPLAAIEGGDYQDCCFAIAPNHLELLFASAGRDGISHYDGFKLSRSSRDEPFGSPARLGDGVNSFATDAPYGFSSDGLTLYFFSNRAGGRGGNDLYSASRPSLVEPFGEAVNLGGGVNSFSHESGAVVASDGLALFYQRQIAGEDADLWMATRSSTADLFANASPLAELNTNSADYGPSLSGDGLHLFFGSDRLGVNDFRIYVASRAAVDEPFSQPTRLEDLGAGSELPNDIQFTGAGVSPEWPAAGSRIYLLGVRNPNRLDPFVIPDWDIYEATWVPEPAGCVVAVAGLPLILLFRRSRSLEGRGIRCRGSRLEARSPRCGAS